MEILKNIGFDTTENITTTGSSLSYKNGYYLNSEIGRGDLTTEFNVQEFIANSNNSDIVNGFLEHVKDNFNTEQILEIKNNNLSLSNSLNAYYNTIYRNGILYPDFIKPNAKYSSDTVSYNVNIFDVNNGIVKKSKVGTKYIASADSYYVDILVSENVQLINDPKKEIAKTKTSGYTEVKNVSYIENVYINNQPTTKRVVTILNKPYLLLNGYVFPNLSTSPFADFYTNGIDFSIQGFSINSTYKIDAKLSGNTSFTESIDSKGTTDVFLGNSKTYTFRTTSPKKQIEKVVVDGQVVNYDRYNNESKSIVGQYTFKNVSDNHQIIVYFI